MLKELSYLETQLLNLVEMCVQIPVSLVLLLLDRSVLCYDSSLPIVNQACEQFLLFYRQEHWFHVPVLAGATQVLKPVRAYYLWTKASSRVAPVYETSAPAGIRVVGGFFKNS